MVFARAIVAGSTKLIPSLDSSILAHLPPPERPSENTTQDILVNQTKNESEGDSGSHNDRYGSKEEAIRPPSALYCLSPAVHLLRWLTKSTRGPGRGQGEGGPWLLIARGIA